MHRFKAAVFGTGFVGRVHLEGIRRLGYVQVYAIGESEVEKAARLGAEFHVRENRLGLPQDSGRPRRRRGAHLYT